MLFDRKEETENMITIDTLLSGFIGAILAIFYQQYRAKKEKEYLLAKQRLESLYGPLLLIFEANNDKDESGQEQFLFIKEEEKRINDLLLQYYYLIEDEKRPVLLNLYGHRKFLESTKHEDVISAIKNGYNKNSEILLQKNRWSKIKEFFKKKDNAER